MAPRFSSRLQCQREQPDTASFDLLFHSLVAVQHNHILRAQLDTNDWTLMLAPFVKPIKLASCHILALEDSLDEWLCERKLVKVANHG